VEWAKQAKRAIDHVLLVIGNNPTQPIQEILARPDIQQALHVPFQEAGAFTLAQVKEVWAAAGGPDQSDYLDQLLTDVYKNTVLAPARMQQAMTQGDSSLIQSRMTKVAADLARRNSYSVRVAEVRARTEKDLLAIAALGQRKMWQSKLDESTCSYCAALHGQIIDVLEPFPADAGGTKLRVYGDLLGPPRHPRCRCRLVPVP
jgi:hypothetical protein